MLNNFNTIHITKKQGDQKKTNVRFVQDLEALANKYEQGKNKFVAYVGKSDFIGAAENLHDSIVWKAHQRFVKSFNGDNFERIFEKLQDAVADSSSIKNTAVREAVIESAKQDTLKEQYVFCLGIRRILAMDKPLNKKSIKQKLH